MNDPHLSDSIFGDDASSAQQDPSTYRPAGEAGHRHQGRLPRAEPTRRSRRRDREHQERRARGDQAGPTLSRRKAGFSCLALLVAFVVLVGGAGYALRGVLPSFGSSAPSDYTGNGTGHVDVVVNKGDTGFQIGQALQEAGVVMSANTFARFANADSSFADIQPGTYRLRRHMSSSAAISLLLDPTSKVSHGITIPEGLWDSEIFAILSKKTGVPVASYHNVDPATLGLPAAAHGDPEGYLFPSTYTFNKGTTAQQQLKAMVTLGKQERASLGIPADRLGQVIIIASLVQGESRLPQDGPKVARVVQNRLAKGMPLQMDSTVHFAEKKRGTVTTSDRARASNSPYNTYKVRGLPPGPINNPGIASIKAALHPAAGSWLYFVTVNQATGKTLFATTYSQQQVNEGKFHQWCQQHPGKC